MTFVVTFQHAYRAGENIVDYIDEAADEADAVNIARSRLRGLIGWVASLAYGQFRVVPPPPRRTVAEAEASLANAEYDSLAEWAYESHKDFYGCKGRHMTGWSKEQLLSWITAHFYWDEARQVWNTTRSWED